MTVIGVLLILLAALLFVAVLTGGSADVAISILGAKLTLPATGVFLLGVATVLVLMAGLVLLRTGLRRSLHRRRELKQARAVVAEKERRAQPDAGRGQHRAEPTDTTPTATSSTGTTSPDTPGATDPDRRDSTT
jgi:membrane protein implicated in regulation of membrane protease activity